MAVFDQKVKNYVDRQTEYEQNKTKAFGLLLRQCSKTLRNKIEGRNDYANIHNDPFQLLKTIREHSIAFDERKYGPTTILETMRALVNIRQRENEQLVDYTSRFKHTRDVLKEQIDKTIEFKKYMDESSIKDEKTAFEHVMTQAYLEGTDRAKYGSLILNLNSQFSLKNDQFPKQISDAQSVLSNHRWDKTKEKTDIKKDETPELSFAQIEGKCYCCGKGGHKSPECRDKKKIPKDQWAINKLNMEEKPKEVKSCAQWSFLQKSNKNGMRTRILLDSQSSVDLFCNPKV